MPQDAGFNVNTFTRSKFPFSVLKEYRSAIALSFPKPLIALCLFFPLIPTCNAQGVMAKPHQAESKIG